MRLFRCLFDQRHRGLRQGSFHDPEPNIGIEQNGAARAGSLGLLANFCHNRHRTIMGTMNISLPNTLKSFVEEQVSSRGYGTSSEYVRELIRKEQERQQLRSLLLDGAASAPTTPIDESYFKGLRDRALRHRSV